MFKRIFTVMLALTFITACGTPNNMDRTPGNNAPVNDNIDQQRYNDDLNRNRNMNNNFDNNDNLNRNQMNDNNFRTNDRNNNDLLDDNNNNRVR